MKTYAPALYKKEFTENISAIQKKWNHILQKNQNTQDTYAMSLAEERLFHIKTLEIIDELTQIVRFIKELERFWVENSEVLLQIRDILSRLRSNDRNYKYTRIVHVLTKYLSGIRNISSLVQVKSVLFYKRLFESTLVAIIREIDCLEEDIY